MLEKCNKFWATLQFKRNSYATAFQHSKRALELLYKCKESEHESKIECLNCIAET